MQMLVVPVVFVSLICGCSALEDNYSLSKVGSKAIGLYLLTTTFAIVLALSWAQLWHFGHPESSAIVLNQPMAISDGINSFKDLILSLFPSNPLAAMVQGNMIQIIFFALLFGTCLTLSGQAGRRLQAFFCGYQ